MKVKATPTPSVFPSHLPPGLTGLYHPHIANALLPGPGCQKARRTELEGGGGEVGVGGSFYSFLLLAATAPLRATATSITREPAQPVLAHGGTQHKIPFCDNWPSQSQAHLLPQPIPSALNRAPQLWVMCQLSKSQILDFLVLKFPVPIHLNYNLPQIPTTLSTRVPDPRHRQHPLGLLLYG